MDQWDTSRAGIPPDPGGNAMAGPQQNLMGQPVSQNGTSTSTQGIVTDFSVFVMYVLLSIVDGFERLYYVVGEFLCCINLTK